MKYIYLLFILGLGIYIGKGMNDIEFYINYYHCVREGTNGVNDVIKMNLALFKCDQRS